MGDDNERMGGEAISGDDREADRTLKSRTSLQWRCSVWAGRELRDLLRIWVEGNAKGEPGGWER